jgi:tetratricopeptide (TPR) repeat protein
MPVFDQRYQRVDTQINIAVIQPPDRPPLQRPPRAEHFTGREEELAQLLADLQPGRAVTLCGPGGVGKTALAAEAIWILAPGDDPPERFPDGILFHSFYTQPQADLALEAIARAYGEEPRPTPRDAARRALSGRTALLVLDGAENADDLGAVLEVTGGCGVLITGQRHGDAPSEWQDIAPLPEPEAIQLLQAWGGERAADEAAARRICELVGGLPLAVRLAGRYLAHREEEAADYLAWLEETPLTALDHGQRQRDSVPMLLVRSLERVSVEARDALAVVGVLALAPFSREVMAAALDVSPAQASRILGELVNYGLVLRIEERYQASHALVHTYARRRSDTPGEVIERLAAYYDVFGREQSQLGLGGYQALDVERPHVMALLSRCVESEAWQEVISLAWAIGDHGGYFDIRGRWADWITTLNAGLTAARALVLHREESYFLGNLGVAYSNLGQVERAIEYHKQALAIAREVGDRRSEGYQLGNLANVYHDLGQMERAIECHQQALAIARVIDDRYVEGSTLNNLGLAYSALAQVEQAIGYYEQAVIIAREIGDRRGEGHRLGNLGAAYGDLGQMERAIEYYEQALTIAREIGERAGEGADLGGLGNAYRTIGQVERAIEYYQQALTIAREIGDRRGEANRLGNLGLAYSELGQVEQAIEHYEQSLAISREIGDRRGEGNGLGNLGNAYHSLGQVKRAVEYHEQALAISRETGDRRGEAADLGNLASAYYSLEQAEQARKCLEEALTIFEEIRSPSAEKVREQLAMLGANDRQHPPS